MSKKVVRGAPVFVDENNQPIPAPVPAHSAQTVMTAAVAPAPAPVPARPAGPEPGFGPAWLGLGLLAALLWAKWFFKTPKGSFAFEPELYAPGETAKGTLLTPARPDSIKAVFELYRADSDVPVRAEPVTVGETEQGTDGFRTPISVVLPADLRPDFEGGWALSIKAVVKGRTLLAGENPTLREIYLDPPGPRKPGDTLRAMVFTPEKPGPQNKAVLSLDTDEPGNDFPMTWGTPKKVSEGWLTPIECKLPARPAAGAWDVEVEGVDWMEDVEIRA